MGFQENSHEFIACVEFLETIKPISQHETDNVMDFVSLIDSPTKQTKATILDVAKEDGKKDQ